MTQGRTSILTLIALIAFAANSILTRAALGGSAIDAGSFAAVRIVSGAIVLLSIVLVASRRRTKLPRNWGSASFLALYAVPFSFAYVSLPTGTGALILFGVVQTTMLIAAISGGERLRSIQWVGLAVALAGLVYLVLPGLHAPPIGGSLLMALAGVAWGMYSLRGRGSSDPVISTASNFLYALPFVLIAQAASMASGAATVTSTGIVLAVASGAVASGLGYVVWYAALKGLTATRASIVQLAVPAIAAGGGVIFMNETITPRLVFATIAILGGVALAISKER